MKHKPALEIVFGMGKPHAGGDKGDDSYGDGDGEGGDDPCCDAASALIDAVKANDPQGVVDAMKMLRDLTADEPEEMQ